MSRRPQLEGLAAPRQAAEDAPIPGGVPAYDLSILRQLALAGRAYQGVKSTMANGYPSGLPTTINPLTGKPGPVAGPTSGGSGCGGSSLAEIGCEFLFPSCGPEYRACVAAGTALIPSGGNRPGGGKPGDNPGTGIVPQNGGTMEECPSGYYKVGNQCVSPGDMFPGGTPGIVPAGGGAVQGAFGLPAIRPAQQQRVRLRCPSGMVLGKDNLCYPKQLLGPRSKYRKWRADPKPKVSAAEWKTLKRAERTRDKIKEVAKTAGYSVKKR